MKIDVNTKVYCLLGYPVKHSLSPVMHNAAFKKLGINATYVVLEVPPRFIDKAINVIKTFGISGANVTIPHKEGCIKHLDKLTKEAKLIGAVNTIVNKNNKLIGYNTDGIGFLKALKEDLGITAKGKKVFLIGAGGAAKAVATTLAAGGAESICVVDKVRKKANKLSKELKKNFSKCKVKVVSGNWKRYIENSNLLINATPIGMKKKDALLVKPEYLHKGLKVYDLVYNVPKTKLVEAATKCGLKASCGLSMLLYQGVEAFKLWTGKRAPVSIMRKTLLRGLK